MIKILIGGSPCTHWSIAQKNNREKTAEGIGWELFKNYLIAKEKFKPDFFLYENNKSAAQAIRDQISLELGVPLQYINSALVSAQNRQRFYAHNIPNVPQPEDREILLRDILVSGTEWTEKAYCLTSSYYKGLSIENTLERKQRTMIAEPTTVLNINPSGKGINGVVSQINGKSHCLTTNKGEGQKIIEPVCVAQRGIYESTGKRSVKVEGDNIIQVYEAREDGKTNTLTTITKDNMIAEPVRIGSIGSNSQAHRVYSCDGKSVSLIANGGGQGAKTGLYACPLIVTEATKKGYTEIMPGDCVDMTQPNSKTRRGRNMRDKSNCLMTNNEYYQYCGTIEIPIYEVKDGLINIKGKQYPIKLVDGYYIIRKLTVTECCRLQTLPDDYCRAVSASQAYKGLGNGWTAEVIIHILKHMNIPLDQEIVVLSMYDGIGTGRYCFDKLGYKNIKYYAYEIDKYAMQVAMSNYPDIIQCGDAFQVGQADWKI